MSAAQETWAAREALLVRLIALHSVAIGLVLIFGGEAALRVGGFAPGGPLFFMRQGGAFHLVVATLYLLEYRRQRGITALVVAKSIGVAFLLASSLGGAPWSVAFSGLVDAAMLVSVLVVRSRC